MRLIVAAVALCATACEAFTFVQPLRSTHTRAPLKMTVGSTDVAASTQAIAQQLEELTAMLSTLKSAKAAQTAGVAPPDTAVAAPVAKIPPPVPHKKAKKDKDLPLVCASYEAPSPDFIYGATMQQLEANPYWDQSGVPTNTFKPKEPYPGTILSVERLTGAKSPGEVCHVTIDHGGKLPYWEGQSLNVLPPGTDANGKPHKVRLYSIASSRYGDDGAGRTVTLCVRRALFTDPESGKQDPAKAGVCSNFLCDAAAGAAVSIAGPSGKIMLMPEQDPTTDIIMVGTGTGVAPYRGFVRRLFQEDTPAARAYTGQAWLFLGVANRDALLYHEDWLSVVRRFPFNFRYDVALSREQQNRAGGKMYIQDKMEEYADELFDKLDNGAHIYFCGLKGMMPGINDMLARVARSKGLVWEDAFAALKKNGQWHVEVY
ncbi:hypothetical protein JKP88DRAFT_269683 [Tribonema minus]|uniref:ferredoxin--NADP(+) reductase n=1 Tax=Tribonema minus TaxID=303371 RepID=A0A836CII9_9STRA|nr:hypothetical protein JKP88DRAFT_269683 [Tribonema minus]